MFRSAQHSEPTVDPDAKPTDLEAAEVVQAKGWLLGIGLIVWRRVLVPNACTLRELQGVLQVAMGWRAFISTSSASAPDVKAPWRSASSPDGTLAALRLCKDARLTYEYDLNSPWRHEVRIEESRLAAPPGKTYPSCIAGDGACPPEDCGGARGYLDGLNNASSWDASSQHLIHGADCPTALTLINLNTHQLPRRPKSSAMARW